MSAMPISNGEQRMAEPPEALAPDHHEGADREQHRHSGDPERARQRGEGRE